MLCLGLMCSGLQGQLAVLHLVQDHFGSQVVRRAAKGVGSLGRGHHLTEPKIGDLDVASVVKQDVFRLHCVTACISQVHLLLPASLLNSSA